MTTYDNLDWMNQTPIRPSLPYSVRAGRFWRGLAAIAVAVMVICAAVNWWPL